MAAMEHTNDLRHIFSDVESSSDEYHESSDFSDIDEALRPQRKSNRRRPHEPREEPFDPDLQILIGEAQSAFSSGSHDIAIRLAEEVIASNPNARLAYNLLSAIYDDLHDPHKALTAKIMATHLNKKNKDDWIDIAERSLELGNLAQAAEFYQSASRVARDDWTLLISRARILLDLNQPTRSLSLLRRVKEKFFSTLDEDAKTKVILETARILKQLDRTNEATELYLDVFNRSLDPERYGLPEILLNWQNLNVIGELLFEQGKYAPAIRIIKSGARWILGRGQETIWRNARDDSEFDDRRLDIEVAGSADKIPLGPPEQYELPIDIRIWLLVCRLRQINDEPSALEDAMVHLGFLERCVPVEDYQDLYTRAAGAFFQAKRYEDAIKIYTILTGINHESHAEYLAMTIQVAKCHMELGEIKAAEDLYKYVLGTDDRNIEALVALGEIYQATNRPAGAKLMVDRVFHIREEETQADELSRQTPAPEVEGTPVPLIITPVRPSQLGTGARLTQAERAELELTAQKRADANYELLDRFQTGLDNSNIVAAGEWIRSAVELVQMFGSNRKFFPSDRNKVFAHSLRKASLDDRVAALQDIAREDAVAEEEADEEDLSKKFKFRGRSFDFWFWLFMRSALAKAHFADAQGAYELVRTAEASNIFHVEPSRKQTMSLVLLSCAWQAGDNPMISDTLRHVYMDRQFHNDVVRIYGALMASGQRAMSNFGSSNNQKFFLRQIKAVDSVVQKKRISGAARVVMTDENADIEKENPLLFTLYAHIMLMGPSYVPALTYLMRALEHLPNDPVVLLTLGVVYVQRAIQRVTTNRHLQILQGLSYMEDYRATRQKNDAQKQEAEYNMGRYYHGLGLFSLAIPYYERVLAYKTVDPAYCLSMEAAYNLHLIAAMSGNMARSRELVDKYLVI